MDVLILNGSLEHQTNLQPVQKILEEEFANAGWKSEAVILHQKEIKTCIGCLKCWDTTPGLCFQKDQAEEITKKAIHSDLLVFLTPLTWGGYSSELKKAIERMLGLLQPTVTKIKGITHHKKRYDKYPSVFGLAVVEGEFDEEEEKIFKNLVKHHSLNWYTPKQKAKVFTAGEDKGKIRAGIKKVIAEMEEKND